MASGRAQSLTITTFAGQVGSTGSADGTAASARFSFPSALVVDAAGNVFVNDTNNYTVRKITPAGVVTTIAGSAGARAFVNGTGAAARFQQPVGLARDSAGNLYVGDWDLAGTGPCLRKITPQGVVTTLTPIRSVRALVVDAKDRLCVASEGQWTLRAFTLSGVEYAPGGQILGTGTPDLTTPPLVGDFGSITALAIAPDRTVYDLAGRRGGSGRLR